jgi:beta-lactamase superfamily II metal-dependent hydrolase
MSDRLSVTMLPAKEGDCLHVAYGPDDNRRHLLVDAGRQWTWKNALGEHLRHQGVEQLDLVVVSHIDRDHIDGMLALARDPDFDIEVGDFWFNTWDHLLGKAIAPVESEDDIEHFGAKMGEELSTAVIKNDWPWNHHFNGASVELRDDPGANVIGLGDLTLTLLSPSRAKLEALKTNWKAECKKAGLTPGATVEDYVVEEDDIEPFGPINIDQLAAEAFEEDGSEANGSSIAFILDYKGARVLLSGDAHVALLVESLKALGASAADPMQLAAFKVPHHGSKYNVSNELLGLMNCGHYLVSTNGNYFKHPEDVAIARLIKHGTPGSVLHFNYKTKYNEFWKNGAWEGQYAYSTHYPDADQVGFLTLDLPVD